MKFKNTTKEDILIRRGTTFKPDWENIKPGKEIDIDETIGKRKGLTKVGKKEQETIQKETEPEPERKSTRRRR